MTLIEDWKIKITKLWSIRFAALSAVLGTLEVVMPLISAMPADVIPPGVLSSLSALSALASMVSRVVAQPALTAAVAAAKAA